MKEPRKQLKFWRSLAIAALCLLLVVSALYGDGVVEK